MQTDRGLADMIVKMLKDVKIGGHVILFLKTLHLESKVRYEKIYKNNPPSKLLIFADRIACIKSEEKYQPTAAMSFTVFEWLNKKPDGSFDKDTKVDWIRYK